MAMLSRKQPVAVVLQAQIAHPLSLIEHDLGLRLVVLLFKERP
jgi:hypothetical protein